MPHKLKAYPSLDSAVARITALYQTADDTQLARGMVWYQNAHDFAVGLSEDTAIPMPVVCHVIAVLSPNCFWDRNKTDAEKVCVAFHRTGDIAGVTVSAYPNNLTKAGDILATWRDGERWDHILSGPKVTAFAANIERPDSPDIVTLDTHALAIAMGVGFTINTVPKPRPAIKERYRRAYRIAASDLGVVPCQVQAVTWCVYRERRYNLYENNAQLKGEDI